MKYFNYLFLLVFLVVLAVGVISFYSDFSFTKSIEQKAAIGSVVAGKRYGSLLAEKREIELAKAREINLVLVGDVMLARGVANQIKKSDDFNYPFLNVADFLNSADLVFGNLEGPISEQGKNQGSVYSFKAEPGVVQGLSFAGFSVMSLANNHILDWGTQAMLDTVDLLGARGIKTVGAGRDYDSANQPVILERNGTKIAFLAYTNLLPKSFAARENTSGISDFDISKIKAKIEELKTRADLVIVSMHWGEEYQTKANLSQQKIAHELIEDGADLVVGHHPHVPEEIEQYNPPPRKATEGRGGWIIYSLGNFVFDQNFSEETMGGLVAKVKIRDGKIDSVEPIKIKINSTFQPYLEIENRK